VFFAFKNREAAPHRFVAMQRNLCGASSYGFAVQIPNDDSEVNQNPIRMMLALLLYSYMNGIYSSRQIAAATYERVDFRVLPDLASA